MEKITVKQAIQRLNTSRATLYKYLKQCGIETTKEKNKVYLSLKQLETVRQAMNHKNTDKQELSKTTKTLEIQLKEQVEKLALEKSTNERLILENERLKIQNTEHKTRAEVLDDQNKKILFQMGAIGERVATLELEKQKLIKSTEIKPSQKQWWEIWK